MIEVSNLVKKYGDHTAVDHLSFQIEKGKIYGFLGPNGAGKSTTMNMITGYSKDTTVAPIIYKVKVWVSSTGGLLMKLTNKQTPEHMVNKIQQTISIFLFIISSPDCNLLSIS